MPKTKGTKSSKAKAKAKAMAKPCEMDSEDEQLEGEEEEEISRDEIVEAEASSCKTRKTGKSSSGGHGDAKKRKVAANSKSCEKGGGDDDDDDEPLHERIIEEMVTHCSQYAGLMFKTVKDMLCQDKMEFDGKFKFDIYFSRPAVGVKMHLDSKGSKSLKEIGYFGFGKDIDWNISISLALACANCLVTYLNLSYPNDLDKRYPHPMLLVILRPHPI